MDGESADSELFMTTPLTTSFNLSTVIDYGGRRSNEQLLPTSFIRMRQTINTVVLPIIFGIGVVGNLLNLVMLTRRSELSCRSRRKGSASSLKRNRSDRGASSNDPATRSKITVFERSATVGLFSMTLSDLAFCLVGFGPVLFWAPDPATAASPAWRSWLVVYVYFSSYRGALLNLFLFTSTWLIALVSAERYLAICHPFRASSLIRVRRTIASHVTVVLVSILVNVPMFLRNSVISQCDPFATRSSPFNSSFLIDSLNHTVGIWSPTRIDGDNGADNVVNITDNGMDSSSSCPVIYLIGSSQLSKCCPSLFYMHRALWFAVGTFLPLVLIAFCNARLVREVYAIRRHQASSSLSVAASPPHPVITTPMTQLSNGRCQQLPQPNRNLMSRGYSTTSSSAGSTSCDINRVVTLRLTTTLIAIVVGFIILVCPSMFVQFAWFTISGDQLPVRGGGGKLSFQSALLITDLTQAVKFSSNFLLYCLASRSFRRTFSELIIFQRCRMRCKSGGSPSNGVGPAVGDTVVGGNKVAARTPTAAAEAAIVIRD